MWTVMWTLLRSLFAEQRRDSHWNMQQKSTLWILYFLTGHVDSKEEKKKKLCLSVTEFNSGIFKWFLELESDLASSAAVVDMKPGSAALDGVPSWGPPSQPPELFRYKISEQRLFFFSLLLGWPQWHFYKNTKLF